MTIKVNPRADELRTSGDIVWFELVRCIRKGELELRLLIGAVIVINTGEYKGRQMRLGLSCLLLNNKIWFQVIPQ